MSTTVTEIESETRVMLGMPPCPIEAVVPVARPPEDLILEFQQQSPSMIGLVTGLTNGLYLAMWFDRQARVLARLLPKNPLAPLWLTATWCLTTMSAGWLVIELCTRLTPAIVALGGIITQFAAIMCFAMAFQVRSRLNELLAPSQGASGQSAPPFSAIGTSLGNIFYLQWKINKLRQSSPGRCCRQCGYSLKCLPLPRCPECGTPFDAQLLSEQDSPQPMPAA